MKNLIEIANQATTLQAEQLKTKIATTTLANDLNSNYISLDLPENQIIEGKLDNQDIKASLHSLIAYALLPMADKRTYKETFDLLQNDFISELQSSTAEKLSKRDNTEQKAKIFLHSQQTRTAEEYKVSNIELNLKELAFTDVKELLSIDGGDKFTKAQLLEVIHNLQAKIWTSDKQEVYEVMIEKEEAAKAKYKALYDGGFTDIIETNKDDPDKRMYFSNIDMSKMGDVPVILSANGFTLVDTSNNFTTKTVKVIFKDGATEKTDI